ncbi:hypothetical protein WA026_011907 [Henosepilachna vigintioctopunctata]|uniref:receptor protein-tyrosine kinase n=1 Tax=Henosepilachna vigintioctopunctata TaxID=420089 RepID=A0AAW1UKT3_9CUCU
MRSKTSTNFDDEYEEDIEECEESPYSNGTLKFTSDKLKNTTRDPGKIVKFICEVENLDNSTKATISWHKYTVPIEANSPKIQIKNVREKNRLKSTLKIGSLEFFDTGFYSCYASNGIDKICSQAALQINSMVPSRDTEISNGARGFVNTAQSSSFLGELTTLPSPHQNVRAEGSFFSTDHGPLSNGLKHTNGLEFDLSPTGKQLVPSAPALVNLSEPFCQIYHGERCKDLLHGKYVFVQPPYTQQAIEDKLNNAFLVISQSNDISSSCEKFVHPSMCFSAFPICLAPKPVHKYQKEMLMKGEQYLTKEKFSTIRNTLTKYLRRVCKDDCLLLETELCLKEYAIARRHPIIGQIPELEECELLPDEIDGSTRNCLSLGVELENIDKEDTCYWDQGHLYRGTQDITISGKKCMKWSHQLHISLSDNPELTGHNYCRNPGNAEDQPFCFVDQNDKELCDISKCVYVVGLYIFVCFAIISLGLSLLIAFFCCRGKKKPRRNLQNMNTPTADKNIYGNHSPTSVVPMEMNRLLPPNIPPPRNHHPNKGPVSVAPQFTHKEVIFIEELGEGAFGKVYKGELKLKNGQRTFVAVKSLKENASAKTQADFQREIELISELKHPNIICLLGVVLKQDPICMLFEYMSEGDLHEFLIANSPNEGRSLTQNQFLHIAIQIAQGMEYLSENHYVHRDLAARNCLVSKDLIVKISDFGLSRDMYSCDYYRVQSKSLLPVRWMPPESILYGKFTTESDVWSYGVVLWEIYSYGLQPYYGFNNQEVINMIRSRKLLPCPEACPSHCYSLMIECWAELAIRRPNFSELSHRLKVWKHSTVSNAPYIKTPEHALQSHKYGHSSKSSHSSDNHTVNSGYAETSPSDPIPMDRNLARCNKLNESQNSLSSRCSSLGNKTQSTSLSNEVKAKRKKKHSSLERTNPKNMVVSSIGDNIEIKINE